MTEKLSISPIDLSNTEQCTLSVRLSAEEFSYSIYNPAQAKAYRFFKKDTNENLSMAANVKEAIKENDFLKQVYRKVNVMVVTKKFTLIPFELFEDEQVESILYHSHTRNENEIVLYNILKKANVVVAFAVDKSAHWQILDQFPDANFYCQASPLTEYLSGRSKQGNNLKMYAYLRKSSVDVMCYDRGKVLLINNFKCSETADIIYYLLYVWKQLEFNQERDELHLMGNSPNKESLANGLKQFVRQLFVISPKKEFSLNELSKVEDIPFDLQILSLCEL